MQLQYPDPSNNVWLIQNCTGLYLQMAVDGKGSKQAAQTDILVYAHISEIYVPNTMQRQGYWNI